MCQPVGRFSCSVETVSHYSRLGDDSLNLLRGRDMTARGSQQHQVFV